MRNGTKFREMNSSGGINKLSEITTKTIILQKNNTKNNYFSLSIVDVIMQYYRT